MTRRVLLLDDEPMVRRAWLRVAERLGVHLVPAASVAEARALLAVEGVDCAVCDWNLGPNETSEPLLLELTERGVPVVVSSGDADALARLHERQVTTLSKPCPLDDVERVLIGRGPESGAPPLAWCHAPPVATHRSARRSSPVEPRR